MAPYNPRKYPYMMSCSLLNFEDLQWITPRNGVSNLLALNLDVLSCKWTFLLPHGGRDFTGQHLFNGTKVFFLIPVLVQHMFYKFVFKDDVLVMVYAQMCLVFSCYSCK